MAGRVVSKRKRVVRGLLLVDNVATLIGRIAHRERKGNEGYPSGGKGGPLRERRYSEQEGKNDIQLPSRP